MTLERERRRAAFAAALVLLASIAGSSLFWLSLKGPAPGTEGAVSTRRAPTTVVELRALAAPSSRP
jgi:hypothetical protein